MPGSEDGHAFRGWLLPVSRILVNLGLGLFTSVGLCLELWSSRRLENPTAGILARGKKKKTLGASCTNIDVGLDGGLGSSLYTDERGLKRERLSWVGK